jgi:hypothetical protein
MSRPGVLIIFALTLAGVFYPVLKRQWQSRAAAQTEPSPMDKTREGESPAKFSLSLLFTGGIILIFSWALWESKSFGFRAGLFPWSIGYPVLALAIVQFVLELMGKGRAGDLESEVEIDLPKAVVRRRSAGILGWIFGFYLLIWLVGFSYAVPITTFFYLKFSGKEKWPMTIIFTAATWGFFYGVFDYALRIPFPEGLLISLIKGGQ